MLATSVGMSSGHVTMFPRSIAVLLRSRDMLGRSMAVGRSVLSGECTVGATRLLSLCLLALLLFGSAVSPAQAQMGHKTYSGQNAAPAMGGLPFPEETTSEVETIAGDVQDLQGLNPDVQKQVLKRMGDVLVGANQWACNIFGGTDTCPLVGQESVHSEQCPGQNRKVDCAFQAGVEEAYTADFYGELGALFNTTGLPPCPSCLERLRQFWCAQAVPTCGTFDHVLDQLLPGLQEVLRTREQGKAALKKLMPAVLHAAALGFPSRELCLDVLDMCTCTEGSGLGEILDTIEFRDTESTEKGNNPSASGAYNMSGNCTGRGMGPVPGGQEEDVESNTGMSPALMEDLFAEVRKWRVCDVFVSRYTKDFRGLEEWVDVSKFSTEGSCHWCPGAEEESSSPAALAPAAGEGDQRGPTLEQQEQREARALFEKVVVAQMVRSVTSIIRSGLEHVLDAAGALTPMGSTQQQRDAAAHAAIERDRAEWGWRGNMSARVGEMVKGMMGGEGGAGGTEGTMGEDGSMWSKERQGEAAGSKAEAASGLPEAPHEFNSDEGNTDRGGKTPEREESNSSASESEPGTPSSAAEEGKSHETMDDKEHEEAPDEAGYATTHAFKGPGEEAKTSAPSFNGESESGFETSPSSEGSEEGQNGREPSWTTPGAVQGEGPFDSTQQQTQTEPGASGEQSKGEGTEASPSGSRGEGHMGQGQGQMAQWHEDMGGGEHMAMHEQMHGGSASSAVKMEDASATGAQGGGWHAGWLIFLVLAAVAGVGAVWVGNRVNSLRNRGDKYVSLQELGYQPPVLV